MIKMMVVILSMLFMVAACNKNNSKADRVKKDPAAPAVGTQKPAGTAASGSDKGPDVSTGTGGDPKADDKNQSGGSKTKPEDDKADKGASDPVVQDPSIAPADKVSGSGADGNQGTTQNQGDGKVIDKTTAQKTDGGNADIMKYNSMNYSTATMTTDELKNRLVTQALLSTKDELDRKVLVYCYDAATVNKIKAEKKPTGVKEANIPELYLMPGSEVLMEVKNEAAATADKTADENAVRSKTTFVLGTCKGVGPDYIKENESYDVINLSADQTHMDYFTLDTLDRDYVEMSVVCSHDVNVASKMERKLDDTKKFTLNRLTLSRDSKIMFARPTENKDRDKQTGKTLKETKNFKRYGIVTCQ